MTLTFIIVAIGFAAFFAAIAWRLARDERSRSAARVAALGEAIDEATVSGPIETVEVQHAFLAQDRPSSSGSGVVKVAVGFAAAVAVIVAITTMGTSQERRAPSAVRASAAQDAALELLSMRHDREGDTLTVTGLVRNGGSASADRLIAVVFSFDRAGNFLASGRAPLEFVSLAPGDESAFRVSVPAGGAVGRYRVSFRTEAGIVRHVDRRQALVARRAE